MLLSKREFQPSKNSLVFTCNGCRDLGVAAVATAGLHVDEADDAVVAVGDIEPDADADPVVLLMASDVDQLLT